MHKHRNMSLFINFKHDLDSWKVLQVIYSASSIAITDLEDKYN